MQLSAQKLAVGAVRLAAMSQLGPIAGRLMADSDWAKAGMDLVMNIASNKVGDLFGAAVQGFRTGQNHDPEKSMLPATQQALSRLESESPPGFGKWWEAWRSYLKRHSAEEVFAGIGDLHPEALMYENGPFRSLWWNQMEPVLVSWRRIESAPITGLNLGGGNLDLALAQFVRERLPEALNEAHEEVLRSSETTRGWIAFQQRVYGDTLNYLHAIRVQLDRIERTTDRTAATLEHLALKIGELGPAPSTRVWTIPLPAHHFNDRPELIGQIDRALQYGATALTALHGLGGIGKSQLARRFAQQRHERYALGAWIAAETPVSLSASLSTLAPLLGIAAEQDQAALAIRVINELSTREPWLVIFDNAESAETLRPYLERLNGNGHVLITSRNEHWDGLTTSVSVTHWSIEESGQFLRERCRSKSLTGNCRRRTRTFGQPRVGETSSWAALAPQA